MTPSLQKGEILRRITALGIVPVVRASSSDDALRMIEALMKEGIDVIELTMTVPKAISLMNDLATRFGRQVVLGAGTVLDAETARACILSGASFIVSPMTDEALIRCCRTYGVPVLPGALTPSEVVRAWQAGADMVKIFPCSAMGGPAYVKSLKAPLPQIEMVPTGGVSIDNVAAFFRAGATAVGAGADLVSLGPHGDTSAIRDGARRYLEAIESVRAEIGRR